jgi:hypothetical protein
LPVYNRSDLFDIWIDRQDIYVSAGKCNHGDLTVVDWVEKVPAIITDVICPDGQSRCQTGQTCCKLATGNYGCCPRNFFNPIYYC